MIWVSISLCSGLSPTQYQYFAWTSAGLFQWLIVRQWRIYMPVNCVNIGSDSGPSPILCRTAVRTSAECWPINNWTMLNSTPWNLNQSFIATMQEMDLEMLSALCPPFYLADDQLQAYIPHYNLHILHWWYIFLCVMYIIWYFRTSMFGIIVVHWSGATIVVLVLPSLVALEFVGGFLCNLCKPAN